MYNTVTLVDNHTFLTRLRDPPNALPEGRLQPSQPTPQCIHRPGKETRNLNLRVSHKPEKVYPAMPRHAFPSTRYQTSRFTSSRGKTASHPPPRGPYPHCNIRGTQLPFIQIRISPFEKVNLFSRQTYVHSPCSWLAILRSNGWCLIFWFQGESVVIVM